MKIIGANLPNTLDGMKLNDGGLCLIDGKDVTVIAEERVSRKKYLGGFENSLDECLKRKNIKISDIDMFVFSSCCEKVRNEYKSENFNIPSEKVYFIDSHHLSHAYSTYFASGFKEAIIIVIDNEGNIIDNNSNGEFHKNILEHMTYYTAKDNEISFLERDEVNSDEIGIGDAYRYFTHYLGFPSYVYAGKTMGLAPYGNPSKYKDIKIFEFYNNKIRCKIKNNYFNPIASIQNFFREEYNIEIIKPRSPIDEITQEYSDLAYLIQKETEEILIKKIKYLVNRTGIKNVCIAGGVGLNSVANGRVLRETGIEDIFIVPAAGDTGQCLGNAYYGYYNILKRAERIKFENAYLGFNYESYEIDELVSKISQKNLDVKKFETINELNKYVALKLLENKIIGRFSGRSEFGPRALGNRSILMNPTHKENKDILNSKVKFRESFRPFAPIVIDEYKDEYFDLDRESPYMLLVSTVKKPDVIPAVTHVDNSARVQTLTKAQNDKLYDLLKEFHKLSNVPVLLNTSFNIAGEPIVESPDDALNCFINTNIDLLVLENYIIEKIS